MKVLNFGSCNMDHVYALPHFVRAGETINADGMQDFLGGKGFNQSIAIAQSGTAVYHAGCIGADGEALRQSLNAHGVQTDYLKTVDAPTGHAIIQVTQTGENCIIIFSGANACVTREDVDKVLADFDAGDILLLQNEISQIDYLISAAAKKGMRIIFNPSPFREALKQIDYSLLYAVVINEVEGFEMTGETDPDSMLAFLKAHYPNLKVVLTLGGAGCRYLDCATDETHAAPAFNVQVCDTTAAGDTFMGYYISGIVRGLPMGDVLRLASAASALAVSKPGASSSIPTLCQVEEALKTLQPAK